MTFARGTKGLDSAQSSIALGIPTAQRTGAAFWMRYVAGQGDASPASQFKIIKPGELAAQAAGSISTGINMEWSETEPLNGHAAGLADAQHDLPIMISEGYRPGSSVYISLEPGNSASQVGQLQDYFAGYQQGLSGQYQADGLYAGIPLLRAAAAAGFVKHGWLPESTSANGIPSDHSWIYMPTPAQLAPAMAYLDTLVAGIAVESIIWQNGNKWFNNAADENVVLLGGYMGTHLESGQPSPTPPPPIPTPPPAPQGGPHFHLAWPGSIIPAGQYFGNVNGPKQSHGGYYANERPYVAAIQDRLLWLGLVPGRRYPDAGWADGVFDTEGNHSLTGATTQAVTVFQQKYRAHGTTQWGRVYADDWATLFGLTLTI